LKVAGRDFACRAVAFFHGEQGRANFTIALDDPTDDSHIITFSGQNSRREQDNLYELQIDRMLLNSRHRPRVDGLPVPFVESSAAWMPIAKDPYRPRISKAALQPACTKNKGRRWRGGPLPLMDAQHLIRRS